MDCGKFTKIMGTPMEAEQLATQMQRYCCLCRNVIVEVLHIDAQITKNCATKQHQNNQHVYRSAGIEITQVDLDWQHKLELFLARWAFREEMQTIGALGIEDWT